MAEESGDAPKLIIDSDWKNEAQAEREKLAATEQKASSEGDADGEMPKPDFNGLMGMLATQAVMYMGGIADPNSGKPIFDPLYAQHMIELLGVLEEKTKGNLTEEEARELGGVLHELRSRFVELMQIVAKQQAAGAMGGAGLGGKPVPGM